MTWVKLTDDFTEHPKILAAGPLAGWLWVCGLAWSNRNGTDGRIPRAQVPRLAVFDDIGVYTGTYTGDDVNAVKLSDVLVDVGLWELTDGGFLIHDYSEYQPTVAVLQARSDAKRRAGRAGGQAAAEARARAPDEPAAVAGAQAESKPVSRIPKKSPSSPPPNGSTSAPTPDGDGGDLPERLWERVAERKLAMADGVKNPTAWKRRVARNAADDRDLVEHARRLNSRYQLTVDELASLVVTHERGEPMSPTWLTDKKRADV